VPKDTGSNTLPTAWMTRPPKPYKGVSGGCNRSLLKPILSYTSAKMISVDEPLSTRSFPKVHLAILASIAKASLWGKLCNHTCSSQKVIRIWDHLILSTLPSMQMIRTSRK
jgi:hypothetical protein